MEVGVRVIVGIWTRSLRRRSPDEKSLGIYGVRDFVYKKRRKGTFLQKTFKSLVDSFTVNVLSPRSTYSGVTGLLFLETREVIHTPSFTCVEDGTL